jgi:hypothetical protein
MRIFKKENLKEEIIASFYQPREGDKIALLIAAFILTGLLIILILLFSMDILIRLFSPPILILLIIFFFGGIIYFAFDFIDKAKIGYNLLLTNKGIRYRNSFIAYEKIKGIYYWPLQRGSLAIARRLSQGFAVVSLSPENLRKFLGEKKYDLKVLEKMIKNNFFFIPPDVESLPELLKMLSRYIPQAELDLETLLFIDLGEGGYLLANSSDLFQAQIYDGKSSLPALHNFFLGLRDLLRFNLASAYQKLSKAFSYGELRARPYLALTQYLLQKYEECVSLLTNASPALNEGERLILASSLTKQGKWDVVREIIEEIPREFSERFQLGYLCAIGNWKRLIEMGEKQKDGASLNLCLNCARKLLAKGTIKPLMERTPSPPKVGLRYYLGYILTIIGAAALAFLKSWHKSISILLYFIAMFLFELLPKKYMMKELLSYLTYQLKLKFASPYWCSSAYLEEEKEFEGEIANKSLNKGGLENERGKARY